MIHTLTSSLSRKVVGTINYWGRLLSPFYTCRKTNFSFSSGIKFRRGYDVLGSPGKTLVYYTTIDAELSFFLPFIERAVCLCGKGGRYLGVWEACWGPGFCSWNQRTCHYCCYMLSFDILCFSGSGAHASFPIKSGARLFSCVATLIMIQISIQWTSRVYIHCRVAARETEGKSETSIPLGRASIFWLVVSELVFILV